jgi:hypothetical protein
VAIKGYIDSCNEKGFSGWVLDKENPDTKQHLIVKCGDAVLGSTDAALFRRDLVNAGHGDGFCAFQFNFDHEIFANKLPMVRIEVAGTEHFFPFRVGRPVTGQTARELYSQSAATCDRIGRTWRKFPRCILHIGTEKTGSTSLQHWLDVNREVLRQEGYLVPQSIASGEYEHVLNHTDLTLISRHEGNLTDDLRRKARAFDRDGIDCARREVFRRFSAEAEKNDNCHTLILSNEHCHSRLLMLDEVQNLKDFLDFFCEQYKIVVFIRPQHELAISQYGMLVAHGVGNIDILPPMLPPRGYAKRMYTNRLYFDYDAMIRRWSDVFGDEAINLNIYDGDVIGAFQRNFSLPAERLEPTERRNVGISAKGQAFLAGFHRCLDNIGRKKTNAPGKNEINELRKRGRKLVRACFPGPAPCRPGRRSRASWSNSPRGMKNCGHGGRRNESSFSTWTSRNTRRRRNPLR